MKLKAVRLILIVLSFVGLTWLAMTYDNSPQQCNDQSTAEDCK